MVQNKIQELEEARAKLAALEQSIASELNKELASLPAKYGFSSTEDFISAVYAASGKRRGRKPGRPSKKSATGGQKTRKRAVITDETRAEVKKMAGDGKTGAEIAKALKISLPSVQNIKKALGLVKDRK